MNTVAENPLDEGFTLAMAEQWSPEDTVYFQMLAEINFTKHMGGLQATVELLDLCDVDGARQVLDVGDGVGFTAVYIARRYGCRVAGVDIFDKMAERAQRRAEREGVAHLVEFRVADAQGLPFDDELFDVVICESVLAMVSDQEKAANHLVRVTRPGGYVGISESTWLSQPPQEVLRYFESTFGGYPGTQTAAGWRRLLEACGLGDVSASVHTISTGSELRARVSNLGVGGLLRLWYSIARLSRSRPQYRRFIKRAVQQPKGMSQYWGYGVYAGRKPEGGILTPGAGTASRPV